MDPPPAPGDRGARRPGMDPPPRPAGGAGPRRDTLMVVAAFAVVYLVWGSTYLAIAWMVETIPPLLAIGTRCLVAGAALYGWARWRGAARPTLPDWRAALVAGTLLFATGQAVLAWAETRIASGPAALLIATEPLFVVLLGWRGGRLVGASERGDRPTGATVVALLAGFAGVGMMVLPGGGTRLDAVGAGAALLASLSWSVGVFRAQARPGLTPGQRAGMQLLAGGVVLTLTSLITGEAWSGPATGPSLRSLLAFAYLVVFGSVVAFGAYVWLLERVGPKRLSTHAYVNPVVAVALGAALAGEPVTGPLLAAMALILGSVAALMRRERAAPRTGDRTVHPGRRPREPRRGLGALLGSAFGPAVAARWRRGARTPFWTTRP